MALFKRKKEPKKVLVVCEEGQTAYHYRRSKEEGIFLKSADSELTITTSVDEAKNVMEGEEFDAVILWWDDGRSEKFYQELMAMKPAPEILVTRKQLSTESISKRSSFFPRTVLYSPYDEQGIRVFLNGVKRRIIPEDVEDVYWEKRGNFLKLYLFWTLLAAVFVWFLSKFVEPKAKQVILTGIGSLLIISIIGVVIYAFRSLYKALFCTYHEEVDLPPRNVAKFIGDGYSADHHDRHDPPLI